MNNCDDPRMLPGFRKKSLLLPYGGGEIWFEHLDGIYSYPELVIEKLNNDRRTFCRPSYPSMIGIVLDETSVTPEIINAVCEVLLGSGKLFLKVCFIGTDRKTERAFKSKLTDKGFFLAFINDFEKAKEWFMM